MKYIWLWRLLFLGGFLFLISVGVWTIIAIIRIRRDQETVLALLRSQSELIGLKRAVQKLEDQTRSQ